MKQELPEIQMRRGHKDGQMANIRSVHPVLDINVEILIDEYARVLILHEKPFQPELSWVEYDLDNSSLDFIMENGDMRNWGVKVKPALSAYIQNAYSAILAKVENGVIVEADNYPLIVHRI